MDVDENMLSPIAVGSELAKILINDWCSHKALKASREQFKIPKACKTFEKEMFYMYYFLFDLSIRTAFKQNKDFSSAITEQFSCSVSENIERKNFSFNASPIELLERKQEYGKTLNKPPDHFGKHVSHVFIEINSNRSDNFDKHARDWGQCHVFLETAVLSLLLELGTAFKSIDGSGKVDTIESESKKNIRQYTVYIEMLVSLGLLVFFIAKGYFAWLVITLLLFLATIAMRIMGNAFHDKAMEILVNGADHPDFIKYRLISNFLMYIGIGMSVLLYLYAMFCIAFIIF